MEIVVVLEQVAEESERTKRDLNSSSGRNSKNTEE